MAISEAVHTVDSCVASMVPETCTAAIAAHGALKHKTPSSAEKSDLISPSSIGIAINWCKLV
ncbi:hypothetical protein [Chromobacterium sp. CV08]|uniref:hypothetical protein n=1 Tax=Chromobacterium sp. CV08 TaxID=3133274 RepID=UPI003DA96CED